MAENTATVGAEVQTEVDPFRGFVTEGYDPPGSVAEKEPEKPAVADATGDAGLSAKEIEEVLGDVDRTGDPTIKNHVPAKDRITQLLAGKKEAERRAEVAERRAQELASKLPPEKPAEPPKAEEKPKGPPAPADFEFGELDSRYIAATVKYHTEQGIAEFRTQQKQEAEQREQAKQAQEVRSKFDQQTKSGEAKYDDYYEKVIEGAEKGDWPLSQPLGELLVQSEVAHDIAYHLATHPEEAVRIYQASPLEQARTFGRLEAQFSAAQPAATVKAEVVANPITPRAPAPVTPSRGAGGRFQPTAQTQDFAAFERLVKSEGLL